MADPMTLPFDVRGGSPTILEVSLPSGEKKTVRVAVTVIEVLIHPGMANLVNPGTPVFQVRASLAVDA